MTDTTKNITTRGTLQVTLQQRKQIPHTDQINRKPESNLGTKYFNDMRQVFRKPHSAYFWAFFFTENISRLTKHLKFVNLAAD